MHDLNELIDPADPLRPYVTLHFGNDINDLGQVLAQGYDSRLKNQHAYVASPLATPLLPNVVGMTQAAATTAITNAGFVLGTVTEQTSSTVASGYVISESPVAGTMAVSGSTVNLVVSTGSGGGGGGDGGGGALDSLTLSGLLGALALGKRRRRG